MTKKERQSYKAGFAEFVHRRKAEKQEAEDRKEKERMLKIGINLDGHEAMLVSQLLMTLVISGKSIAVDEGGVAELERIVYACQHCMEYRQSKGNLTLIQDNRNYRDYFKVFVVAGRIAKMADEPFVATERPKEGGSCSIH